MKMKKILTTKIDDYGTFVGYTIVIPKVRWCAYWGGMEIEPLKKAFLITTTMRK